MNYGAAIVWADPDTRTTPTNRGDGVADGDFITCTTATPCTAAQLANVTAVKLYVLVRGRDESQGYTDTKTYTLAGSGDGTVQRWLQAPRLRDDGAPAQYHGPESHAMILSSKYKQRGAALVVGLIMLVLITLMLITALNLGTANFRSVTNMQFREEAIAAANQAIEQVISSTFTAAPVAETIEIDIDNDDDADYVVDIALPVCVSATQASAPPPSSIALGPPCRSTRRGTQSGNSMPRSRPDGTGPNVGSAAARVHAGVRVLLTGTQKTAVCS